MSSQHDLDKALVSKAIQTVLLDHDHDSYDRIIKKLNKNNLFLPDCFDNPKYFSQILNEEFGTYSIQIIYSIHIWLGDSSSNESISNFLVNTLQEKQRLIEDDKHMTTSVIVLAIEKALQKMGTPELKKVESKLMSDFNYTLNDCVRNPIPLKTILCDLFGNCYEDIYNSMSLSLFAKTMDEPSTKFLILMKA